MPLTLGCAESIWLDKFVLTSDSGFSREEESIGHIEKCIGGELLKFAHLVNRSREVL